MIDCLWTNTTLQGGYTLWWAEEIVLRSVDTQDSSSVTTGRVSAGEEPGTHTTGLTLRLHRTLATRPRKVHMHTLLCNLFHYMYIPFISTAVMGGVGQPGPDIGLWSRVLHPPMLNTGRSGTTPSRGRHLKGTGRCWPAKKENQLIAMHTNLKFTRLCLCVTCMKFQRHPIKHMYNIQVIVPISHTGRWQVFTFSFQSHVIVWRLEKAPPSQTCSAHCCCYTYYPHQQTLNLHQWRVRAGNSQ